MCLEKCIRIFPVKRIHIKILSSLCIQLFIYYFFDRVLFSLSGFLLNSAYLLFVVLA